MSVQEMIHSSKPVLTPAEVSKVLGCDPNKIRATARTHPERLGFPVCVVGTRVKIPRIPFLRFICGAELYQNITE